MPPRGDCGRHTPLSLGLGRAQGAVSMALVLSLPEDLSYRQGLFRHDLDGDPVHVAHSGLDHREGQVIARLGLTGAVSEPPERQRGLQA